MNTKSDSNAGSGCSSHDLLAVPVSYRLPFSRLENPPEWQRTEIVATKFADGNPSQWKIHEMQMVMAKEGEWEWEPSPSNRDDDFLTRTRFDTAEDAAACALKFSSANAQIYPFRNMSLNLITTLSASDAMPCSPAPIRVQLSRKKGWRMPANTVKVCRPGKWGNPFRIGGYFKVGGDATPLGRFIWMERCIWKPADIDDALSTGYALVADQAHAVEMFERLMKHHPWKVDDLRGKNLACWCKPGTPCHADVLLRLANAEPSHR